MKLLLDACIPVDFRHALAPAAVETARYAGLSRLSNGRLISAMAGRFDVLITVDTALVRQQPLGSLSVAVIVLRVKSNRLQDLWPLAPRVLAAVATVKPGDVIEVSA
jgi:predicted nuclease of predicted toxin-antitoxin system